MKWEDLADKMQEKFSQLFRNAQRTQRWSGSCFKVAVACSDAQVCGRKRLGVAKNDKNNSLMEDIIQAKKVADKAWFQNKADSLHLRYAEARKSAALTVNKTTMQSWENYYVVSSGRKIPQATRSIKDRMVSYSAMRRTSVANGESISRIS